MATQFWLRNPQRSIRQALAEGVEHYVFDQALTNSRRQTAHAFMREHFSGTGLNPQFIVVGDQGARLYNLFTPPESPIAVWPVWSPADGIEVLETYLAAPQGEDVILCTDPTIERSVRPVYGQEHRVVMTGIKYPNDPVVAKMIAEIRQLFDDYPDAVSHMTETQAFSLLFGWNWNHADWSLDLPRSLGDLILPNGIRLTFAEREIWDNYSDWIELVGWSMDKLSRLELVQFHIRAARWAAGNYTADTRHRRKFSPDENDVRNLKTRAARQRRASEPRTNWRQPVTMIPRALPMFASADGDKLFCNHCVARTSCKLARADMVCSIGGTEMGELAKYFGTRDPNSIIEGMLKLLTVQSDRMEEAIADERNNDETNPEVTRQINSVFKNAGVVAKLIDPNLNGKGTTITNQTLTVNGVQAGVNMSDPRQVMSAIVKELELAGIPRAQITPTMIKGILEQSGREDTQQQQALEGVVVQNTAKKE